MIYLESTNPEDNLEKLKLSILIETAKKYNFDVDVKKNKLVGNVRENQGDT